MNYYSDFLTEKKSFKLFFRSAIFIIIPIILESFVISSVSFADNFMIGRLKVRDDALLALFIVNILFIFCNGFVLGVIVLTDIFFAQYLGQKNKKRIEELIRIKIWFALVAAIIFIILLAFLGEKIITLFTQRKGVITIAKNYLKIMLGSFFLAAISQIMVSNLRIIRKVKIPLFISSLALLSNIFLNWIFIYQLNLGVQGSAWATLLVRMMEVSLLAVFVRLSWEKIGINWKKFFTLNPQLIKKIFSRGMIIFSFMLATLGIILRFSLFTNIEDQNITTAVSVGFVLSGVAWSIFPVISVVIKIFIGPALGNDDLVMAKKLSKWLLVINGLVVLFLMILLLILAFAVPRLMELNEETIQNAQNMMIIYSLTLPLIAFPVYVAGLLQAGGYTLPTVIRHGWVLLVLYSVGYFLFEYTDLNFIYVHLIIQTTWIVPTLVALPFFNSKIWLRRIVEKPVANEQS